DLSTGSIDNVAHLKERNGFRYFFDTIFNRGLTAELVDHCDVVIHLAAAVGVRRIVDHPVETIEINVRGTELVLELAAKKLKRVLLASTSEVYGKSTKFPFAEDDDLVMGPSSNCRWGYACSKAIDEFLALAYFREKKLPVTILRFFNTTGPRQTGRYGMVLPNFVQQALAGEPVTVYGSGEQSRCFGHVADVIEGVIACVPLTATHGQVFNLGNPEEISINDLARRVIKMTGSSSKITYVPYSEAYGPGFEDMERRVPDIAKAQKFFGFKPTRKLEEIIESVIAHERTKQSAKVAQLAPR
ncbi:MAG TPA: GDP-mannose 4,6-dehydratase, partial [Terriglobales bacterium]|nr:GDP-mannose 4,6-dehydratase [Terriglobales bacterium]